MESTVFEGGKFKITAGTQDASSYHVGNGGDAKIYIGKSLMQTIRIYRKIY